jgi:hypothetical protein
VIIVIIRRDQDHDTLGANRERETRGSRSRREHFSFAFEDAAYRSSRLSLSLRSFVLLKKMVWFGPVASRTGPAMTQPGLRELSPFLLCVMPVIARDYQPV